jgi:hypothetical protein
MTIDLTVLRSPLAKEVAAYLEHSADYPQARLLGVTVTSTYDRLHLEIEPTLSQKRAVRILDREPLDVLFYLEDREPRFISRRADFPKDQVHTTYYPLLKELTLCLWAESWENIKRQLTAQALVERIRTWYSRVADGTIHQPGQTLEPLLNEASHTIILPPGERTGALYVEGVDRRNDLMFVRLGRTPVQSDFSATFDILEIEVTTPVAHGSVRPAPYCVADLEVCLRDWGVDLLPRLEPWLRGAAKNPDAFPLVLISIPKTSVAGGQTEAWEYWGFTSEGLKFRFAEALGLLTQTKGIIGAPVPRPNVDLGNVFIFPLRIVRRLVPGEAREASGLPATERAFVAVGAGALGSHVVVNAAHTGLCRWTIIDDDIVLPHNTVRLPQGDIFVGAPKAFATAKSVEILFADNEATPIRADLLKEGDAAVQIAEAISAADLTCDFTASPAVLGNLADRDNPKRLLTMFFNPRGDELVILAEDADRSLKLDELEAQYFQAIASKTPLAGHLTEGRVGFVRYANACNDLSRPLPPWQVQTLAAIGAGQLARIVESPAACATVWQLDPETASIRVLELPVNPVLRQSVPTMRLTLSKGALEKIRDLRARALPSETGGILIGSYDLSRGVVHVVDALPAPADSVQEPTYFIRGKDGLLPTVDAIEQTTVGQLQYVGEWHSHPRGISTKPSGDDQKVLQYLADHIGPTGAPFGIMICGDRDIRALFGWRGAHLEGKWTFNG